MALQNGETFKPYTSKTGQKIEYITESKITGAEILTNLTTENNSLKWIFRIVGIIFVCVGFAALSSPIQTISNIVPLAGRYISWAIGWVSCLLGLSVSFIIIAIAWLRYRPLISLLLLVGSIGIILICKKLFPKKELETMTPEQLTKIIPEEEIPTNNDEVEKQEEQKNTEEVPQSVNLREFYHNIQKNDDHNK